MQTLDNDTNLCYYESQEQVMIEEYLSIRDASKILGTSRMTLYRWIEKGTIKCTYVLGMRTIHKSEIERLRAKKR